MNTSIRARTGDRGRDPGSAAELGADFPRLGPAHDPFWAPVIIRLATEHDRPALAVLAELDCAPQPVRVDEALIGEVQGRAVAAVSLRDGRVMADPFLSTGEILDLVTLRASQLAERSRYARRRPPRLRSLAPAHTRPAPW